MMENPPGSPSRPTEALTPMWLKWPTMAILSVKQPASLNPAMARPKAPPTQKTP